MYTIEISKPPPLVRPSMAATEGLSAAETQSKQSNTQHLSSLKKIQLYIYIHTHIHVPSKMSVINSMAIEPGLSSGATGNT
jgi:hypothetical protein